MSRFTTPLRIEDTGVDHNGRQIFRLLESFDYELGAEGSGYVIRVPVGFETDFASIPRGMSLIRLAIYVIAFAAIVYAIQTFLPVSPWFVVIPWVLLGAFVLISVLVRNLLNLLPPWGKHGKAAVLHDFLYRKASGFSKVLGDAIFYEAMENLGVSLWRRYLMYLGVSYFGYSSYNWQAPAPPSTQIKILTSDENVKPEFTNPPPSPPPAVKDLSSEESKPLAKP